MDEEIKQRALELRRQYNRERARAYRERNRESYNAYQREWKKKNAAKERAYKQRYWEQKAQEDLARRSAD